MLPCVCVLARMWNMLVAICVFVSLEIFVWSAVSEPQLAAKTQWGEERFIERGAKIRLTLVLQGGF